MNTHGNHKIKKLKIITSLIIILSIAGACKQTRLLRTTEANLTCTSASCLRCPKSPSICEECVTNYYLDAEDSTCKMCPDGCTECESRSLCTSCTPLKELNGDKHCVMKKVILWGGIGAIVTLILVCVLVMWIMDKKMQKKELKLRQLHKKKM